MTKLSCGRSTSPPSEVHATASFKPQTRLKEHASSNKKAQAKMQVDQDSQQSSILLHPSARAL